jgi:hypothetical protein
MVVRWINEEGPAGGGSGLAGGLRNGLIGGLMDLFLFFLSIY